MFICVPWTLQPSVQGQLLVGQTEILLLHWMGYNKHRWKILVCAETTWVNKLSRKPRTCAQNCREGLCLPRQMLTVLWPGPQNCPVLFSCSYKFGKIMLRVGKAVKNLIPAMKTWNALKSMGQVCKNGWQNLNEAGTYSPLGTVLGVMPLHLAGFCPEASSVSSICVLHGSEVSSAKYILPVN